MLLMNSQKTPLADNENDEARGQGLRVVTGKGSNAGVMLTDKSRDCPRVQDEDMNEIKKMFTEDPALADMMNEFIESESFKFLGCALNRILTEVRESENPKETVVVIGWSLQCNPPELSVWEDVLAWLSSRGMKRSHTWLYNERDRLTRLIRK